MNGMMELLHFFRITSGINIDKANPVVVKYNLLVLNKHCRLLWLSR